MKLLIIRHGDPDYEHDSLTEKGWREAEYLAEMLSKQDITSFYCSPYGRARDTASLTLKKMGREAETLPWMAEFTISAHDRPDGSRHCVTWDLLPAWRTEQPKLAEKFQIMSIPTLLVFENGKLKNQSVGLVPKEQVEALLG